MTENQELRSDRATEEQRDIERLNYDALGRALAEFCDERTAAPLPEIMRHLLQQIDVPPPAVMRQAPQLHLAHG
jgi:hypothetical protein